MFFNGAFNGAQNDVRGGVGSENRSPVRSGVRAPRAAGLCRLFLQEIIQLLLERRNILELALPNGEHFPA